MPKHNPTDRMLLVTHRPGHKRRQIIRTLFIALVSAAAAYYIGISEMKSSYQQALDRLDVMAKQYSEAIDEKSLLEQQVTNLEQSDAINAHAKQEIQATISALRARVALLQKDVSFYQNIMAPSKNNKGLQIQTVEMTALPNKSGYAYKIVLSQLANNRRYIDGVVAVNIVGSQYSESLVIPLRDVSSVEELGMKFRFRYFQEFEGEIRLPEGFTPEQLQVVAQSKGKSASRIESTSEWRELLSSSDTVANGTN